MPVCVDAGEGIADVRWGASRLTADEASVMIGDGTRERERGPVRHTEFWARMEAALGAAYARTWAKEQAIAGLDGMTVIQALDAGWDAKRVWREVWKVLELPARDR